MIKELTCISCPLGCQLRAEYETIDNIKITGNGCPRGLVYAKAELVNPVRMVTGTLRMSDGSMISGKTSATVPKDKMFEVIEKIKEVVILGPVKCGEVLVKGVFEGVDFISTADSTK